MIQCGTDKRRTTEDRATPPMSFAILMSAKQKKGLNFFLFSHNTQSWLCFADSLFAKLGRSWWRWEWWGRWGRAPWRRGGRRRSPSREIQSARGFAGSSRWSLGFSVFEKWVIEVIWTFLAHSTLSPESLSLWRIFVAARGEILHPDHQCVELRICTDIPDIDLSKKFGMLIGKKVWEIIQVLPN